MVDDIKIIKLEIAKIVNENKIEELNFVETDKIYIKLGLGENDNQEQIKDDVIKLLKINFEIPKVKYETEVYKDKLVLDNAKKIIISSGKGGVGKSFVTSNLANALSNSGYKVAIIDADIYGSSIPMIFDMENSPEPVGEKILPLKYENIELIGTSNVNPNNEAIVWRGPMLGRLLNSFFKDVCWSDDIDYLLVDLPPGTGDIPLDLNQLIPDAKCIVVTTPHINASKVAVFAGEVAKMQNHSLIGVIENMSYYNHNGEKLHIFGRDGGSYVAKSLKTPLLASLPIAPPINNKLYSKNEEAFEIYKDISNKIINSFEK
ncbi:MAG: P-loop NTPase [Bacilli bacterium]